MEVAVLLTGYEACVIEKWRKECLSPDEFSEMRNAWTDCVDVGDR